MMPKGNARRLEKAFSYAHDLHREDLRKGTPIPYISHLLNVCGLVLWDGGTEDEAIAGLLHDSLEDHPDRTSATELARLFGPRVAEIVVACSDTPADYRGGEKPPWRDRKTGYLVHLKGVDDGTRRVSMADKLDNARAVLADYREIGDSLWKRFNAGKADQLWYYRALADTFREMGPRGRLLTDLGHTVSTLERLCETVSTS